MFRPLPTLVAVALLTVPALAQDSAARKGIAQDPADKQASADAGLTKTKVAPAAAAPVETGASQPWQMDSDLPQSNAGANPVGLAYLEMAATDDGMLTAFVRGAEPGFLGMVLLSSSPDRMHFLVGLPPLLVDFAVMGVAVADGRDLWIKVPASKRIDEIEVYGQALTLDSTGLSVSGIVQLGAK